MNVFISYTLRDEIVSTEYLKLVSKVVAEFANPFVDIIDNNADDKQSFVIEQLDKSDLVVLIVTKSIYMSQWVVTEIDRAKKNNTPIVCIPLIVNHETSLEHLKAYLPAEIQKLKRAQDIKHRIPNNVRIRLEALTHSYPKMS